MKCPNCGEKVLNITEEGKIVLREMGWIDEEEDTWNLADKKDYCGEHLNIKDIKTFIQKVKEDIVMLKDGNPYDEGETMHPKVFFDIIDKRAGDLA